MIAKTPEPPYYAVIFTSTKTKNDKGYKAMAKRMEKLAKLQPGFLGIESAREVLGITISYWKDEESIRNWKANMEHKFAQEKGKKDWYRSYKTRVAKVERDYEFSRNSEI